MSDFQVFEVNNQSLYIVLIQKPSIVYSSVIKGEIDCCLLKPSLILDIRQILVAAHKASKSFQRQKLITKTLHTEILYNLSPSKNIKQSFVNFGGDANDTEMIAVKFGSGLEEILKNLNVQTLFYKPNGNEDKIKQIYNIKTEESNSTSLFDSVMTRIAVKSI